MWVLLLHNDYNRRSWILQGARLEVQFLSYLLTGLGGAVWALCRFPPGLSAEHRMMVAYPALNILAKLSDAMTCPHESIFGGFASDDCSFETGQTKTE